MNVENQPRTAVITLTSLASRLDDLADEAYAPDSRCTDVSDRDILVLLGSWMTVADNCVFASANSYEDDAALDKLSKAYDRAGAAWKHLWDRTSRWVVSTGAFTWRDSWNRDTSDLIEAWEARTIERAEQMAQAIRAEGRDANVVEYRSLAALRADAKARGIAT